VKRQHLPGETPVRLTLQLVALIVASLLVVASPAWGWHIRDATYRGTHLGGGTVEFDVSADGKRITRFTATNIRGDICTIGEFDASFPAGTGPEISRHGFSETPSAGRPLGFVGDFHAKRKAHGSFYYDNGSDPRPRCISEEEAWTASTSAPAAGSDECRSAKRSVRKAKRAVRKARRAVRKAVGSAESKARRTLKKAKRKLRAARKKQKRAC
jgi:hypothetical protein